ncbi:bifunctional alpha,alpha-trehalose-phosphate synthase (UDP-forming)/trehalose-phosphatase [Methanofollis sp. W23]|uniref:bifunctional alpha,alpha-trehalose-phosphate synthase (UDP-forming)/trehalose-phosphatase n=1 Tax=Methanofollis sp. W23 TaxID=2817849 RepID=UPI0032AF3413
MISNRLPYHIHHDGEKYRVEPSIGGLATGLASYYQEHNCAWVGWPGLDAGSLGEEGMRTVAALLEEQACLPVFLDADEVEGYYDGFCNSTIWPLFHYFHTSSTWDRASWETYLRVNQAFCEATVREYRPGDIIWVHDYHLLLLPAMLRRALPKAAIGFFNHIPFPSYEIFRILPWRREILEGLLGADLIGFHTFDYVRHFTDSVRRILGHQHTSGEILTGNRLVKVDTFPMGIDYTRYSKAVEEPGVREEAARLRRKYGGRRVILSFDRLDYTKGIPQRLHAFDLFLQRHPEYRDEVVLIVVAVPSRTAVHKYQTLKRQVDRLVGEITGRHGTIDWAPVRYLYDVLPFETLVALYQIADVAFVTSLRDGMNLMAKEFVATKHDGLGVLVLSEMAGAAAELGEAVIVNPFNTEEMVAALEEALTMPENEQVRRNRWMQERLRRYHVLHWANDFMQRLEATKVRQRELEASLLSTEQRETMVQRYQEAGRRLLLLDYDGTLAPFVSRPEHAVPDPPLLSLLGGLATEKGTEVVMISGRDRRTLAEWFGSLAVGLIAEHGVWACRPGGEWQRTAPLQQEWKEEIRPVLERYVDRTPGSFIEEKDFSLVWHYRMADPDLASARVKELKSMLFDLTAHRDLDIMEGSRVLEVKNAGYNKGRAAAEWLDDGPWDFVLGVGDDWTDEYLFEALPEGACSVKVGMGLSKARMHVRSLREVRALLEDCLSPEGGQEI